MLIVSLHLTSLTFFGNRFRWWGGGRVTFYEWRVPIFLPYGQSKANQWIHVLLPVLLAALRTLGDAPTRSLAALAQRLGVTEADAATVLTPLAEEPTPVAAAPAAVPAAAPAAPLVPMTGRNGASFAPKTLLNRRSVIVARKKTTRSKTSCS